jgi:hypothetical protein
MARKRLIAPEFFTHSGLHRAERESGLPLRIAYAGLWGHCDRRGFFEWDADRLKLAILPYDEIDFEAVLSALVRYNFVLLLAPSQHGASTVLAPSQHRVGMVPTLTRWQTFNINEKPNLRIPKEFTDLAPSQHGASTISAPSQHGASTPGTGTGTGTGTDNFYRSTISAPSQHGASTVPAPSQVGAPATARASGAVESSASLPHSNDKSNGKSHGKGRAAHVNAVRTVRAILDLRKQRFNRTDFSLKSEDVHALGDEIYAAFLIVGRERFVDAKEKDVSYLVRDFKEALK